VRSAKPSNVAPLGNVSFSPSVFAVTEPLTVQLVNGSRMSCADVVVVLDVVVLTGVVVVLDVVVVLAVVVLDVVVVVVVLDPPATIATLPIVTAGDGGLQTIGRGPTLPPLAFKPDTDATRPFPVVV
jgi:hypothetical protein